MKLASILLLLLPIFGMSQTKTLLTTHKVFAKNGATSQFEKALAAHAQKYHKGDVAWRVWAIQTGHDAGGYMISEGPTTWATLDGRGDINAEHQTDWETNVEPLTEGRGQVGYYDFQSELSTVQLTDYADKIVITHMTTKPGKVVHARALVQKLQQVWKAGSESVAVYAVASSGEPGFTLVNRLKSGMKELASDFRKPMAERFDAVHGAGAYTAWLKDYSDCIESRWAEVLIYKPALSSK